MTALQQGQNIGDAIARYLKKKQQWEDYRQPKTLRQKNAAAKNLARAIRDFRPTDVEGEATDV